MNELFHIEVASTLKNQEGENICGDVFLSKKIKEENRIIVVLSDGMGHGVKANVLATLTATMAMNFSIEHKDPIKIADIIMNTLPICSKRKMSYSTFSVVDIEIDGKTTILEYDNPQCVATRGNKIMDLNWEKMVMDSDKNKGKVLRSCSFYPRKEDRIFLFSDGISQSGLGTDKYPFGWGIENTYSFIETLVKKQPNISAQRISEKVVNMAYKNDGYKAKDDTSCATIYFREPRKLLLVTGPPYEKENDKILSEKVAEFTGKRILSGATTSDIISRELNIEIDDGFDFIDPELPPVSYMDGIDLVTEGILTLSKVNNILKDYSSRTKLGKGPADQIVKLLLECDEIHLIIGTRINIAHQDPNLPVELEIRRTVVKRIARLLEEKFLKEVKIEFV
jgi:Stage II sporulation protein E (SpoIIE)